MPSSLANVNAVCTCPPTFTLAQFTVGLLIYWTWSNVLTILQQYIIMHRFEVENPIDSFIARFRPKPSTG